MRLIATVVFILTTLTCIAETPSYHKFPIDSSLNLKSKDCSVTIVNFTKEEIEIKGSVFYYLPVSEQSLATKLLPGKQKTFKFKFNYPDFIQLSSPDLKIYNAPGKSVECDIISISPLKVKFIGDLTQENNYYQDYFRTARDNQVYYRLSSRIKDFNNFPRLADSVNEINLHVFYTYKQRLSQSFSKQEYWRIVYNNAFMKYHVPFDMAFKSGQALKINDRYYAFDEHVPLINPDAPVSSEYLWYAVFRLRRQAMNKSADNNLLASNMLSGIDSVYGHDPLADVLKMRLLYDSYSNSKKEYTKLVGATNFVNPENRQILDSIGEARYAAPLVGKLAPNFKLLSFAGDSIALSHYKGRKIIINFWAGWCAPCIKEFPFENNLLKLYKGDLKLTIINVCVDSPFETWRTLSTTNQLQMINLYADPAQYEHLKKRYNIVALPKSVLIDENLNVLNNNFKRASEVSVSDLNDQSN